MGPLRSDGRDIDTSIASLSGEGAEQRARYAPQAPEVWRAIPSADGGGVTYYGQPVLKTSVWGIDIPLYYFVGGAAGAALALGAAIQVACRDPRSQRELRRLSATCHWIGITGSSLGAVFLIHDLGKPLRFLNMMRVFRPTSPMNMGVWILGGAAPTAIATGLFLNREGWLGKVGEVAGLASGVFGMGLSSYTGVLVANSAIPAWQDARRWMPVLFAASGASAAASIVELFYESPRANRITQVYGSIGRSMELAAARLVENSASAVPRVGAPFRKGGTSALWKAASVLTAASLTLSLIPGRSRGVKRLAGALGAAGSLCLRFAVHYISQASSRDARASFDQQRAQPFAG